MVGRNWDSKGEGKMIYVSGRQKPSRRHCTVINLLRPAVPPTVSLYVAYTAGV